MSLQWPSTALISLLLACTIGSSAVADEWRREWLVRGAPFRGIHGLAVGQDGLIYVGSVFGQTIHRIEPASGRAELVVAAPDGMADDLVFAPDGSLYFTGFSYGTLSVRDPGGSIRVLARDLPGMNSVALDTRGRLFATQVFAGDALWEVDRAGVRAPRLVRKDLGGLNGFDFDSDGRLCGPLWFRHRVVCLDVDGESTEVVADGFDTPAAANFDPKGALHAIDNQTGEIFRIDRRTRKRTRIARAPTGLDNLTFAPDGRLFVTNMPDNALYEIDRERGTHRTVIASPLTLPGGIARAGRSLYVADTFALSIVDLDTGAVEDVARDGVAVGSPSLVAANEVHVATASHRRDAALVWDRAKKRVVARWSELGVPSAIAFAPDGRVVVANAAGDLIELDVSKPESRRVLARELARPMGVVRSKQGWVVSEAANGRLVELRDDGSRRTLATDLASPEGVALLPDGRIAVAETGRDRITLVDPRTRRAQTIATGIPLGLADLPGELPGIFPTGLAADVDGSLLLSSDVEGGVLRLRAPR